MTRTMRTWIAVIFAVAAMTMTAAPSSAARPEPLRSGTITGWAYTWPATGWGIYWPVGFSGHAMDCQGTEWIAGGNPECAAWLKSGCNPALAGRDPAITASIEDVAGLADGRTPRTFAWSGLSSGGGVVIQLWTKGCTEIRVGRWRSGVWFGVGGWANRMSTSFMIPSTAKWMTVATNDTVNVTWRLR